MANILAFGDSITYGAWDAEQSGWTARLRRYLDQRTEKDPHFYSLVYNLGISGETTDGLIERFMRETEVRRKNDDEDIVFIFAYGANDAKMIPSRKKFGSGLDCFARNVETVLGMAKRFSSKIILLNITPVVDAKTGDRSGDSSRLNEYITLLAAVAAQAACAWATVKLGGGGGQPGRPTRKSWKLLKVITPIAVPRFSQLTRSRSYSKPRRSVCFACDHET